VVYGQPRVIRVDSTAGFADGAECWYQDVQPGDEVEVHSRASLLRTGDGSYRIVANTPVTVEAQGAVSWRTGDGEWQTAQGTIPHGAQVRIGAQ